QEREQVRAVAKRLLAHLHERLVLDWRRKAETLADVRVTIRDILDELPAAPYPRVVYDAKVQAVFDHVCTAYSDDGTSVYEQPAAPAESGTPTVAPSIEAITESVVRRIRTDAEFAELVARQLRGVTPTFARTIEELLRNDEDDAVEFKSTARWDLRERRRNPLIEDAIVKTAAAFLTTVGLEHDYPHVKPANGDGLVNWLTTHLANALGEAAVMRTRARIVPHDAAELCRLD